MENENSLVTLRLFTGFFGGIKDALETLMNRILAFKGLFGLIRGRK